MHKALTVIGLPVRDQDGNATGETVRKNPGDKITLDEWHKSQATDEEIKAMEKAGSISEDMDAELHPDHRPVPTNMPSVAQLVEQARVLMDHFEGNVPSEVKRLAGLDYKDKNSSEKSSGGDKGAR